MEAHLLMCLPPGLGKLQQLGGQTAVAPWASPCKLSMCSLQHGGFRAANILRLLFQGSQGVCQEREITKQNYDLALKDTQYHFYYIQLFEGITKSNLVSRGGNIGPSS